MLLSNILIQKLLKQIILSFNFLIKTINLPHWNRSILDVNLTSINNKLTFLIGFYVVKFFNSSLEIRSTTNNQKIDNPKIDKPRTTK